MINETHFRAMIYCMYMMAGSYFRKTKCANPILEEKCRLQYLEMRTDDQYAMENKCENYLKNQVFAKLPKGMQDSEVSMELYLYNEKQSEIRVVGDGFILRLLLTAGKGKNVHFEAHRLDKSAAPEKVEEQPQTRKTAGKTVTKATGEEGTEKIIEKPVRKSQRKNSPAA